MIDFDGLNRVITLAPGVLQVSAPRVYSAWKEWVIAADNAKHQPAFRVLGGDPLGGGLFAGSYFFLQNQHGWRIKPPEENIVITLTGNLYAEVSTTPLFASTAGSFNTSIRLQTSSLTQAITTEGGQVVAPPTATDIAQAVWNTNLDES
jgi:hypothetical protein